MVNTNSKLETYINSWKAVATVAGICAGITIFYIVKNQDRGLAIYKLLINGMALTWTLADITYDNKKHNIFNYKDDNLYYIGPIAYQLLRMMISTLILYSLKRTQFSGFDVIFGTILLTLVWFSGLAYSALEFSSLSNDLTVYNTCVMVLFAVRVAVVIFVAVRLIYHYKRDNSTKASLFTLNLIRLLAIFVSAIIHGPVLLNHKSYPTIPAAVMIIIILFLVSFKIEYPQNLQKPGTVDVTNMTVVEHVPTGNVNTAVVGHVPAGI
ncbi:9502_t:CDS:2 [Paraglomus occultum]|uniref:9502_t:CDS:1 n=1 Tax=Paraglomus occultum TaxID=144539 RepID=A0A9N9CPX2_9GLOM|nr:9502_t:CDS:2 [Paraglomus occultum]